ncbi:hypothetical protein NP493_277g00046 [Ridgeia piscesae]|uniref:Uncharacterized protein n=1 Tax=Ridgeia piscesae TaxID=27915 RepID=A0AAD9NX89_RIDPI|nr:hypothetical protein NP493_277g00046 [Ridgeia piscesae]
MQTKTLVSNRSGLLNESCYRTFPPLTLTKPATLDNRPLDDGEKRQGTLSTAPVVSIPLEIVPARDFSRILVLYAGGTIGMKRLKEGAIVSIN